jgi:hypothetical protein
MICTASMRTIGDPSADGEFPKKGQIFVFTTQCVYTDPYLHKIGSEQAVFLGIDTIDSGYPESYSR